MPVHVSIYYRWLKSPKTKREEENEQLSERFNKGRGNYGTRRLKKEFALLGLNVSRRRIGRLMEQAGLVCKTRRNGKRQIIHPVFRRLKCHVV
jgi:putative transposase